MSVYLIDTDWVIDVLNGHPAAIEVVERLSPNGLVLSLISYGELFQGAHYANDLRVPLLVSETFSIRKNWCR